MRRLAIGQRKGPGPLRTVRSPTRRLPVQRGILPLKKTNTLTKWTLTNDDDEDDGGRNIPPSRRDGGCEHSIFFDRRITLRDRVLTKREEKVHHLHLQHLHLQQEHNPNKKNTIKNKSPLTEQPSKDRETYLYTGNHKATTT
jgi:hypothetical protein